MEAITAGVVLALCLFGLLRLLIGRSRRARLDAALRRGAAGLRWRAWRLWHARRLRREADEAAQAAIRRASGAREGRDGRDGRWDGNVYAPKSFRKPRKPH
ncbi:hypothetical protein [Piscinibacter sakaiensis]|uniref:Uncharacterized protein n=1 Tax=Piscinibacter sakaiensis TaxID=1547922 RepID=A0A0K8NVR3_PISS1|nr:hypothetical protein [Piscinibacter sakaiensis]GAP34482.1 hypothetical protein ISF6_4657 [Piscinibacter sakaiensis]